MVTASIFSMVMFFVALVSIPEMLPTQAIAQSPYDNLVASSIVPDNAALPRLDESVSQLDASVLQPSSAMPEIVQKVTPLEPSPSILPLKPQSEVESASSLPRRLPVLNSSGSNEQFESIPTPGNNTVNSEANTLLTNGDDWATTSPLDCESGCQSGCQTGCNTTNCNTGCNVGYVTPHSPKIYSVQTASTVPSNLPWGRDEKVTISVRDASIGTVLGLIAEQHGLNLVTGDQVTGNISLSLNQVPLHQALDTILSANGYTWSLHQGILVVSSMRGDSQLSSIAQGKLVRVFELDFASAADLDRVVKGLLSPVGQSFIMETDSQDKRRTHETLIVEDLPSHVARIESYITQADSAPRQVLIEANILEVDLNNDLRHGVDLSVLANVANANITLGSSGFADDTASPAFFFGIDGTDLDGLVELIMTTTDAKKLASPKVLALNGQDARIQIGSSLGYFETITTQTSTLQSVAFLEAGIVLQVTPIISHDGRVLMNVKPEVSGGTINPTTGLPDKDTTEVETTLMLKDGQAMIIGGLIQEEDIETQSKVPYLGDMWKIGRLFQQRNVVRKRSEIIITLVPHILPLQGEIACKEQTDVSRATTPLLQGPLNRMDRRVWEPELPDAIRNPINR